MADDLETVIAQAAAGPKRVQSDDTSVEGRDIRELIEADRYVKAQRAAGKPRRGLRFIKAVPGDTA